MASEKDIIMSPAKHSAGTCDPPKGTDTDGLQGYDIPRRTKSSSGYPEVMYDSQSKLVDNKAKDGI